MQTGPLAEFGVGPVRSDLAVAKGEHGAERQAPNRPLAGIEQRRLDHHGVAARVYALGADFSLWRRRKDGFLDLMNGAWPRRKPSLSTQSGV